VKFGRKRPTAPGEDTTAADTGAAAEPAPADAVAADDGRAEGPWDVDEVDLPENVSEAGLIDLGGMLVAPAEGLEVQLQVDEQSGQVVACVVAASEGAVELRAFAAPRNGDIWEDTRSSLAAEVTRRGGTVEEAEGPWGPELRAAVQVTTPDGRTGTQPSRTLGIRGPRWLLRATVFGRPAVDLEAAADPEEPIMKALRAVVVRRGSEPLAPGEPLPLKMPPNATPRPATP
jgi:hypothetical protein